MFGRRGRRNAQAIDAIRERLSTADVRARTLADELALVDSRVARELVARADLQSSTETALEDLRQSALASASDVSRALGEVANLCAAMVERLEVDQLERRALTEVLARLTGLPPRRTGVAARALGGTVFSGPVSPGTEISLVDEDPSRSTALDDASEDVRMILECLTEAVHRQSTRGSRV